MSGDSQRLLMLGDIAGVVNEYFKLEDDAVNDATPYIWWDRSKKNIDISLPMPNPTLTVGFGRSSKSFWSQEVVLHWYGAWRGLKVPVGVPAGDRVNSRGRRIYSKYRA